MVTQKIYILPRSEKGEKLLFGLAINLAFVISQRQRDGNHTLMPVTAAMIHKCTFSKIDESFKFGDIEFHQVLVFFVIYSVVFCIFS